MLLANLFTRPISAFISEAQDIANNKSEAINVSGQDEFGQLASSLNTMVNNLKQQTDIAQEENQKKERLLHQLLPDQIARRLISGESSIVDSHANVTVLYATVYGFSEFAETLEPEEAVERLNELVSLFDEAAHSFGVDKVKTLGANYLAACGLSVPRLDHVKRSFDLALELRKKLAFFNKQHDCSLQLNVGLDSGQVVAGIVGQRNFIYDVWGEPVDTSLRLATEAEPGGILVSADVYPTLKDSLEFTEKNDSLLGKVWQLNGAQLSRA